MDPTTILSDARLALEATAGRAAAMLRALPDLEMPLPDPAYWTVRESVVHLVNYAGIYADIAQGMASPVRGLTKENLAAEHDLRIADIPETDPAALADLLLESVDGLLEGTAALPGDQPVIFHGGIGLDVAGLVGISLGEHLLHGYDIAAAVGAPWSIDPGHAHLVLYGYAPCYEHIVNPKTAQGLNAGFGIEIRGGAEFTVRFTDGIYSVEPAGSLPINCTISADPAAFLLVGSGRLSQWPAIALGLYSPGGADPQLALRFLDLFVYP
jgi:uncharacterized protein (TIGR03083 family)